MPHAPVIAGSYDAGVVVLSILIAVAGSYAALDLGGRVTTSRGRSRAWWLLGGAISMGIGIWSMHYTGMLAFRLTVPVWYDWPTAFASLLIAVISAAFALVVISRRTMGPTRAAAASGFMGAAISGLHYTAMASMRLDGSITYSPGLVLLSIAFAVGFSFIALWLTFEFRQEPDGQTVKKIGAALVMGAAICVMHYTGMAAATFLRTGHAPDLSLAVGVPRSGAAILAATTMVVLAASVVATVVDRLREQRVLLRALAARLQSVREDERTRVAREIHDELGQALTGIKIDVAALMRDMLPAQRDHLARAAGIATLVDGTIQFVRRIATELRPGILDLDLAAAVEWAAQEFQSRTGITCRVSTPTGDIAVDSERATAIFRILQETLTNVARHADATEVTVRLTREGGNLTMEVRDNGRGIEGPQLAAGRSLGILGMRERALLLGGELSITSAAGSGTTVRLRIPA